MAGVVAWSLLGLGMVGYSLAEGYDGGGARRGCARGAMMTIYPAIAAKKGRASECAALTSQQVFDLHWTLDNFCSGFQPLSGLWTIFFVKK